MTIEINKELIEALNELAKADAVTPELFVERKINGIIATIYRTSLISKLNSADLATVAQTINDIQNTQAESVVEAESVIEEPIIKK